jgi:GTP pyrophosphokinase
MTAAILGMTEHAAPPKNLGCEDLVLRMQKYIPSLDPAAIRKAYDFAASKHAGQTRRSGEPYVSHPLQVAYALADMELEPTCVISGLVHDVMEDTNTPLEEIKKEFGAEVAEVVEGVTKLGHIRFESREAEQAENFRKLILAMVQDIRVLIVKLADRLHNMRTIESMPPETQQVKAHETLDIYAPLADRLGMGRIKSELEELSFRVLYPKEYESLHVNLEERFQLDRQFILNIESQLKDALAKHAIAADVLWRVKTAYSIYKKIVTKHVALEEVYDYLAFRIITHSGDDLGMQDCYRVLGMLHGMWKHVPGRIKDFIAIPKPNNYRSLHTTLMTREGQPFEIQIRTRHMHLVAEEGIAAHWQYKQGAKPSAGPDTEMFRWLRRTVEWLKEVKDPHEFMDSFKMDLYPAEVYVFTPKGDVMSFPRGATPLDFAYRIHTDVGHRCTGAKVNGRLVPIDTPLRNGDIVEIVTGKEIRPSKDWLKVVVTSRARAKIKAWVNADERGRSLELGKELLEKYFRRHKKVLAHALEANENELKDILKHFAVSDTESLYVSLAYGKVLPKNVYEKFFPSAAPEETPTPAHLPRSRKKTGDLVEVSGLHDVLINLSRCCSPIPGENILGYITRGRGISVHRRECANLRQLALTPERMVKVHWAAESEHEGAPLYPAHLTLYVENRVGMLAHITNCIAERNMNIKDMKSGLMANMKAVIHLVVETRGLRHLKNVMAALQNLEGVVKVERR